MEQLSDVGRTAVAQGVVLASGGNLSATDLAFPPEWFAKPQGV
jgi:hypothetical protein